MSETPAETPAPSEAGPDAASAPAPRPAPEPLSIRELLEAGVHFGHQTRRWNPRMKRYLFGERNGVHIVDLDQTLPRLVEALEFVREVVAQGGRILFVGTKRQAQAPVRLEAERAGQFYANNRWLGGMLTNFKTVKRSIERFKELLELTADEERFGELPKKEQSGVNRTIDRYSKSLEGIKEMTRLPDALFVIDVGREEIAVSEAQRLGISIVAVVDSNCDPAGIDFVIPGNDDSIRAIQLYCKRVADACIEGRQLFDERVQAEESARARQAAEAPAEAAAPASGRVVVEIKQPPRRGRGGAASFGGRRRGEEEAAEKPAPAAKPAGEEAAGASGAKEPAGSGGEAKPDAEKPAAPAAETPKPDTEKPS